MREALLWSSVFDQNDNEGVVVAVWVPWLAVLWLERNEVTLVNFEKAEFDLVFVLPDDECFEAPDGQEIEMVDVGEDDEQA